VVIEFRKGSDRRTLALSSAAQQADLAQPDHSIAKNPAADPG